jgi:hypothetical protein
MYDVTMCNANNHVVTVFIVTDDEDYLFPSTAPLNSETHGGDDVIVFARGPWSHLYAGTFEQNFIPHAMAYASCVGDGHTMCKDGVYSGTVSNIIRRHIDNVQLLLVCNFIIITFFHVL